MLPPERGQAASALGTLGQRQQSETTRPSRRFSANNNNVMAQRTASRLHTLVYGGMDVHPRSARVNILFGLVVYGGIIHGLAIVSVLNAVICITP